MENFIAGRLPVLEALKANIQIKNISILNGASGDNLNEICALAKKKNIQIKIIDKNNFGKLVGSIVTQGIVAETEPFKYSDLEDIVELSKNKQQRLFLLILDEIEDTHNLGALIRTAECAGVNGVIIPTHNAAQVNATVIKTSAGATAHMPIARVNNIANTLDKLKSYGVWIYGADMSGEKYYYEHDFSGDIAIVLGNEGKGIRRLVKEKCDFLLKIPMRGKIESLNVSVAGAIILYEASKNNQRIENAKI